MRVSFLPLLVVALSALSPIAAQDPNGDAGTGVDTSTDVPSDVPSDTPTDTSSDTGAAPTDGADTGNNGTANDGTSTDGGDSSDAGVAPSEPSPEFVVKIGGDINSMWVLNENTDQQWTNMTIELMTGSNFNMVHLSYVGQGINAVNSTVHNFRAPMVHPTGQIYFLQFTNPPYTEKVWTGRFTITNADGTYDQPANNATDESGNLLYQWGVGALGAASNNGTAAPIPTAPAQAGVGANGVTLYTQGVNTGTEVPPGITITGVAAATLGAKGPGGNGASRAAGVAAPAAVIGSLIAAAAFFA